MDPNTLSPGLKPDEEGAWRIVPANSAPRMKGKGGWCWYFPAICRRSKKFTAAAWISTTTTWLLDGIH